MKNNMRVLTPTTYYAIKVIYLSALSRTLPYRFEKTEANLLKVESIVKDLNSLFFYEKYTHELVEVSGDPKSL